MSIPPSDDSKPTASGRGPRLVGRVVDPALDDGLSLSGPGAPGAPSLARAGEAPATAEGRGSEHPVRARLLARARIARGEGTEEDRRLLGGSAGGSNPVQETSPEEAPGDDVPAAALIAGEPRAGASDADDSSASLVTEPSTTDDAERPGATAASAKPVAAEGKADALRAKAPVERGAGDPDESGGRARPSTDAPLTPPPGAVATELERIAGRGGSPPPPRAGLSPNMAAALSALVGLTLIGSVGLFAKPLEFSDQSAPIAQAPQPEEKKVLPPSEPERPQRKKLEGPWRVEHDRNKPGHRILSGQIGKQAFLRAIQDAGLPKGEAYEAYGALKEELDLDHCDSRDTFRALVRGSSKELVAFEYEKSKEEVYQVKADDTGRLLGKRLDLKVERNQVRRAFTFDGSSFEDSARRGGFDPGLRGVTEEAFRGHLSIGELERGDRMKVIAQEVTVLGEFSRYAGIEALEIVRAGKPPQRIYYYSHPAEGGYFDENGKAPYEGGWRKPIPGAPITSKFNMKRMHPVLNKVMPHTGTDFGAPTGTPIGSTSPGVISFIGYAGPSGNLVKVKHDGGYESGYAHLSRFEQGLKVGDKVGRLQTVGYCGSTGRSTGPHLHFTMKKDGQFIDPESLNLDGLRVLPPSHREQFAEVRAKYDPILAAIPLPPALTPEASPAGTSPSTDEPEAEADGEDTDNPMMEDGDEPEAAEPAAQAPKAAAQPTAPGAPARAVSPSAIFLTDEELLKMQGVTDDGEVTE